MSKVLNSVIFGVLACVLSVLVLCLFVLLFFYFYFLKFLKQKYLLNINYTDRPIKANLL